ncbi:MULTISPECIES: DUF881 domain-containing protein [Parageobacillus]|jgi:uncharacterized protein YlxW (UPF0749 family)|uniref:DUF881 domain-containing protein n=1 Tax=Parageobacillus thermoglucosidasius TaxID=1426 RepID=A0A1B7KTR7_PARTM|nr:MULTISPECIES: DUF881 domain-containing protein [Parageobacillus]OAT73454.1 hypothetical protein A7K69_05585 [Parageobacillus thermoglucosidasius]BDG48136.1 UPF0749 protein YlxW [Parageobacillus sp. KH3-4]
MAKRKGNRVILAFICFILGFMLSFSYQYTKNETAKRDITDRQWQKEYEYRKQLIQIQKENRQLKNELVQKQDKVAEMEKTLADERTAYTDLAEEAEKLRMYVGESKVKGKGIEITLSDASYIPSEQSATDYMVHEQHVFKVIHELLISGAEAIAINGQRISHRSYIVCNGPVIEVDGTQHAAPFVISAIGNPTVLASALNIPGGVKDLLVQDNIIVKIVNKDEIVLDPVFHTNHK